MTLSKKRNNATTPIKSRKTYCWLEDTHWVASQSVLDLALQHDARLLITKTSSR